MVGLIRGNQTYQVGASMAGYHRTSQSLGWKSDWISVRYNLLNQEISDSLLSYSLLSLSTLLQVGSTVTVLEKRYLVSTKLWVLRTCLILENETKSKAPSLLLAIDVLSRIRSLTHPGQQIIQALCSYCRQLRYHTLRSQSVGT